MPLFNNLTRGNKLKIIFLVISFLVLLMIILIFRLNNFSKESTEKTINLKTDFYEISVKYPTEKLDKNNVIGQFIDQQVSQKKDEWKEGGKVYNAEKDIEKHFPDRPKIVYSLYINYQKYESKRLGTVSYLFKIGEYTGGANGIEKVSTFTFNESGLVNIDSILNVSNKNTSSKNELNDINISKKIFEKAKIDTENYPNTDILYDELGLSNLKNDGITIDYKKCNCNNLFFESNLKNFVITDDGLTFYFDKCKITICAGGVRGVELDWDTLKPYLIISI